MSEPGPAVPEPPETPEPSGSTAPSDVPWQRLDPRMLLVHPVRELGRFLPVLFVVVVAGTARGGPDWWHVVGIALPIVLGVLRYLTTGYRITAGRVELRRGLLNRQSTSVPLDRVRTVDLTATLVHRLLGVTTLRIGTGAATSDDGDRLDLDGLPDARARELRADLLRVAHASTGTGVDGSGASAGPDGAGPDSGTAPPAPPLVVFDVRWLRFAPLTGAGLVVAAAVVGGASQLASGLDLWDDLDRDTLPGATALGLWLALGLAVVVALVAIVVLSVIGYAVTNGGFRLTRADGAWHLQRGLLTTRETSLDEERVAGVSLGEPLALRLARGRQLRAIVTGVDASESTSALLVPPSDADVAPRVATGVLGPAEPIETALRSHGPRARTRRLTRGVVPSLVVPAAAVVAIVAGAPAWVFVPAFLVVAAAAALAVDRWRGLGHALAAGHVVARSGSLTRSRDALAVEHVIGWTLRDTWFQRRAGLTTLRATTAGGRGAVTVLDVPDGDAVALADHALPGLVSQFLHDPSPSE